MLFQIGSRGKDLMLLEKCSGKGTPGLLSEWAYLLIMQQENRFLGRDHVRCEL